MERVSKSETCERAVVLSAPSSGAAAKDGNFVRLLLDLCVAAVRTWECGGSPLAISIAVMPSDQMSAFES